MTWGGPSHKPVPMSASGGAIAPRNSYALANAVPLVEPWPSSRRWPERRSPRALARSDGRNDDSVLLSRHRRLLSEPLVWGDRTMTKVRLEHQRQGGRPTRGGRGLREGRGGGGPNPPRGGTPPVGR